MLVVEAMLRHGVPAHRLRLELLGLRRQHQGPLRRGRPHRRPGEPLRRQQARRRAGAQGGRAHHRPRGDARCASSRCTARGSGPTWPSTCSPGPSIAASRCCSAATGHEPRLHLRRRHHRRDRRGHRARYAGLPRLQPGRVARDAAGRARRANRRGAGKDAEVEGVAELRGDVQHTLAGVARAHAELGYDPQVSLEEGLRRFVAWYRARSSP